MDISSQAGADFMDLYQKASEHRDIELTVWINGLKLSGVSAALPDDGWVNRVKNRFQIIKPYFNAGIKVGCKVALGFPDKWRTVTITKIEDTNFLGIVKYYFE